MVYQKQRLQRLARREEKVLLRRIISLSILSVILAIFIFTVGVSLLGKFADFLGLIFKGRDGIQTETAIPLAPILEGLPAATNSARLTIRGFASQGEKVEIYLGDEKVGAIEVVDSKFEYEDLVLEDGENKINVRTVSNDKASDSSKVLLVILDREEPKLEIESPTEGQTFVGNNRVKVIGRVDADAQVYANGFLASIDAEGKFEVQVPVAEGDSTIEIKALDSAGNSKFENRKITFRK